jgi:septum formation protein
MLLKAAGFDFTVIVPDINEDIVPNESPEAYVKRLADEKSRVAAGDLSQVVVAADTSVVLDGEILGKPVDVNDARRMLQRLSGRTHEVFTGYAVRKNTLQVGMVRTKVTFRTLSSHEIEAYLLTEEPFDKAGSYGIQGFGSSLVDQIEGSFTNVIGLPLKEVIEAIHHAQKT